MSLDPKKLVTASLLAFVAITAATLGIKEWRHSRAVAAVEAARPSTAEATAPVPVPEPEPKSAPAPAPVAAAEEPAPSAAAQQAASPAPAEPTPAPRPRPKAATPVATASAVTAPVAAAPATIVVSYFHTTARCSSCLKIENLTALAVTTRFASPLADKRLVWRVVNVDEPENTHFMKDYALYTKSVVVSEVRGGREVRWKNLDQVWKLLGEPEQFQEYVEKEVRAFLEPA